MVGEILGGPEEITRLLDLLIGRPAWHRDAACREHPELSWFPERGESADPVKAVCAGCLVREECLETALANGDRHGVWGGTSGRTRRALRRATAQAA